MMTPEDFNNVSEERSAWYQKELEAVSGDAEGTARIIRDLGGAAVHCYADASNFDDAGRLIQTAIDNFGRIDILANIAGAFGICPVEELTEEIWDRVTNVKPKGYFNTIRHALPHMIKQKWGRIINATSRAFNGDLIKNRVLCRIRRRVRDCHRRFAI
jgi:3-oxoacyl-[acyl-carrier protein] reductase